MKEHIQGTNSSTKINRDTKDKNTTHCIDREKIKQDILEGSTIISNFYQQNENTKANFFYRPCEEREREEHLVTTGLMDGRLS